MDHMSTRCTSLKLDGTPCESTLGLNEEGHCQAHQEGALDRLRAAASLGGQATKAKHEGAAFTAEDLPRICTVEDAMQRLDTIQSAVLTRRISHHEGNAAAKVIDSWIKAHAAKLTVGLVNELRAELDAKTREIESLRAQLAGQARTNVRPIARAG